MKTDHFIGWTTRQEDYRTGPGCLISIVYP